MSIGTTDPLDFAYLRELKSLAERVRPAWLGDHVCWTGVAGKNSHDLLPLPYNAGVLRHLVERVRPPRVPAQHGLRMEPPVHGR